MFGANTYEPPRHYSPAPHHTDEETSPPAKKQRIRVSPPSRVARLLSRRYALTATSFKYLEIAISVGSVSSVEIIIGDNRGTQLYFPYATWTTLLEQRDNIQRLLDTLSYSPLWIRGMSVQVYTFNGSNVFKLSLADRYIYLQPSTMDFMFDLEHCIDHMYVYLTNNIDTVNSKVHTFVNVLREKNIADVSTAKKAVRESDLFDTESIVDCELLACAIPDIMYIATI